MATELAFGLLILVGIAAFVAVAMLAYLPWKIANEKRSPRATAIGVLGLFGLLTIVFWIVALVWALAEPDLRTQVNPHPARVLVCQLCGTRVPTGLAAMEGNRCDKCGAMLNPMI